MNWWGSGFIPIILYSGYPVEIDESTALLTEDSNYILTENLKHILTET